MGKEDYTKCMIPWMKGGGPERKQRFCIGAKLCSGKARDEKDAEKQCLEAPPPAPKTRSKRGIDPRAIATCVIENLGTEPLVVDRLARLIADCAGKKLPTVNAEKRKWIKDCIVENTIKGNFQETVRLGAGCEKMWRTEHAN